MYVNSLSLTEIQQSSKQSLRLIYINQINGNRFTVCIIACLKITAAGKVPCVGYYCLPLWSYIELQSDVAA